MSVLDAEVWIKDMSIYTPQMYDPKLLAHAMFDASGFEQIHDLSTLISSLKFSTHERKRQLIRFSSYKN